MFDTVIRRGQIIDGTGRAATVGDVGIVDGRIAAIGVDLGEAVMTIDATGLTVVPGFVDVHTHFDGQATWDSALEPSTPHGVTTVVMGNCGVGFAPVRRGDEDRLIELMEGVEDIPGAALHEGMTWGWESFPDYLDTLESRRWAADVATQIPHGSLRRFVMGDRSTGGNGATVDEIEALAKLTREAVEAGAFGFTTSRTIGHTSVDGIPVPGTFAADDELFALARAVRDGGGRIFEVAPAGIMPTDDPAVVARESDWMGRMAAETGLTATHIVIQQQSDPQRWRREMAASAEWRRRGARMIPLVAGRPFGVLMAWELRHPFRFRPSYEALRHLPHSEQVAQLGRPEVRSAILSERPSLGSEKDRLSSAFQASILPYCYALGEVPDYEPYPDTSLGALAEATGASTEELAYDAMLGAAGRKMLMWPVFNFAEANHDALYEQMQDPDAVLGLADGGAHCGAICDASMPTYMLTHWIRDRARGPRLDLEEAVRRLTSHTAALYGLSDRGRIAEGLRADINVIDLDGLTMHGPRVSYDLPAGGLRILQDATGYRVTMVNGVITRRDDSDTGARPGRLLRNMS
jgi:N-acyl-D-aspartate/D-glutamate deacylase